MQKNWKENVFFMEKNDLPKISSLNQVDAKLVFLTSIKCEKVAHWVSWTPEHLLHSSGPVKPFQGGSMVPF